MRLRDVAYALDPVLFAQAAGLDDPDPWQVRILRSQARQICLNCSRQSGKSTVSALIGLHTALYVPEALVLLLAPALRQSQELFRKVKGSYAHLSHRPVDISEESALRLEFSNGSRVVCLPGKEQTIRGFSDVALLVVDEAARVADPLYYSIRPMLAVSGGRLALLSTPFGKRGFFHSAWVDGGLSWERIEITAYDCPRISREWLEQERAAIGDWWFEQEYLCRFKDTNDQVFSYDAVMQAISPAVQPLFME